RVDGEVYPLAFLDPKSFAAGIGLSGLYDKTVGLSVRNSLQPGTKFPVFEQRWELGARYRLVFGSTPTSPSLTATVGYGHRAFKVTDKSALMPGVLIDLPDVEYVGFLPGLALRVPVIPQVAVTLGGQGILVTRTGSIQKPEQYGQATVTGVQSDLG